MARRWGVSARRERVMAIGKRAVAKRWGVSAKRKEVKATRGRCMAKREHVLVRTWFVAN